MSRAFNALHFFAGLAGLVRDAASLRFAEERAGQAEADCSTAIKRQLAAEEHVRRLEAELAKVRGDAEAQRAAAASYRERLSLAEEALAVERASRDAARVRRAAASDADELTKAAGAA